MRRQQAGSKQPSAQIFFESLRITIFLALSPRSLFAQVGCGLQPGVGSGVPMAQWNSEGSADAASGVVARVPERMVPACQGLRLSVSGPADVTGSYTVNSTFHGTFNGPGYHNLLYPSGPFPVSAQCQAFDGEHGVEIEAYY